MAFEEDSLIAEYYKDIIAAPEPVVAAAEIVPENTTEITPVIEEVKPIVAEVKSEPVIEAEKEPVKSWIPEFKKDSDKAIYQKLLDGDDKAVFEVLNKKYGHESLSNEQKALAFIAAKNPELSQDEIEFLAATEYGIGVTPVDPEDLDDKQLMELKKQGISQKKLIKEAGDYFNSQADTIELPVLPSDPDYVSYKEQVAKQAELQQEQAKTLQGIYNDFETNAKNISELKESLEIDIDDSKFALDVNFKLNDEKQKQLVEYMKAYSPSSDEVAGFTNPDTGKFDYKGYMESHATKVFAKDIMKAAIKQAITKDREKFIETELKNSTLRNNDVSVAAVYNNFDLVDAWKFGG